MEGIKSKKESFFRRLNKNKRKQIVFCLTSTMLLLLVYFPMMKVIRDVKEKEIIEKKKVEIDYNILSRIENIEIQNSIIEISGWAMKIDSKTTNVCLVLKPTDGSEEIIVPTKTNVNSNLLQDFGLEDEEGYCGFVSKINKKKLVNDKCYELFVFLNYDEQTENEGIENSKKVSTGRYLYGGELYTYNPNGFKKPSTDNTEIEEVIQNGAVCFFDKENATWVYFYQSKIYFITKFSNFSNLECRPEIAVFFHTTQREKLPEERQKVGADYISHPIRQNVYELYMPDDLFMQAFELPSEYPISYIQFGIYLNAGENKGWVKENLIITTNLQ